MKNMLFALLIAATLSGCATGQKEYYAAETARHEAEAERWKAMGRIAEAGDTTVKAVAMVTMSAVGGSGQQQGTAAPRSFGDTALQWAGLLMPAIVQGYGIRAQSQLGMRQSDNATALGIAQSTNATTLGVSTNQAFTGLAASGFAASSSATTALAGTATAGFNANAAIAGRIQAPAANVTTNTLSGGSVNGNGTAQTLAGNGVIGSGTYSKKDCASTGAPSGTSGPGGNGATGTGATGVGATGTGGNGTGTTGASSGAAGSGGSGSGGSGTGGNGSPSGVTGPGGPATVAC